MVAISQNDLTAAQCCGLIDYNPRSGLFHWVKWSGNSRVGEECGFIRDGYRYLHLYSKQRLAHRVAWLMTFGEWPETYVDHVNRRRDDNRISNLRLATPLESSRNTSSRNGSSSRFLGVTRNNYGWQAGIRLPGRRSLYLGTWQTEEEASAAYVKASKKYFGAFAGGGA